MAGETVALAVVVDGVVLVVGSGTPRKVVLNPYTALRRAGAVVLGFVCGRVDVTLPPHGGYGNCATYGAYHNSPGDTRERSPGQGERLGACGCKARP